MKLEEIKKIIDQGESTTVEFKKSTGVLKAAFETVCAFLNGDGGIVLIGVTDGGKIIGQEVSDRTRQEIAHAMSEIEPPAQSRISITYVSIDTENEKKIIAVKVKAGQHIPYTFDSRAFHRVQSTSSKIPQHRYEQLIVERGQLNHSWDNLFATRYTINDLDQDLILSIVYEAVNNQQLPASAVKDNIDKILERLRLVSEGKMLNAAVVLFGKDLFPIYSQCQMKLARFKGVNKREFLDSSYFYGNIFEMLNQGELFIKRHLPVAAKVVPGQFRRVEIPIIPFDAIREALLNALCHRDYSIKEACVNVAIYADRMEIYSHGGLPPGVTIEKIKQGFSKPRNGLIAEVLHKCGYIETWGRGIQNIIELCQEVGAPEPQFLADDLEFKVIFKFPYSIKPEMFNDKTLVSQQLTARQKDILKHLEQSNESSVGELKKYFKEDLSERTLYRELIALKNMGLIISKGQTRNAVWLVLKDS